MPQSTPITGEVTAIPTEGVSRTILMMALDAATEALNDNQGPKNVAIAILESLMDFEGPHASVVLEQDLKRPTIGGSKQTLVYMHDPEDGTERTVKFEEVKEGYYIVNPPSSFWSGPYLTLDIAENTWDTGGKYNDECIVYVGPRHRE